MMQPRRLSSSSSNNRLGRTLYRQLIRWCKNTDKAIPLSSFVPPVTLKPPHVQQDSLQQLASSDTRWTQVSRLLPSNSKVGTHQMTVPIANAEDAANLFRVVFRMNNQQDTPPEVFKQRISTAFEALKSLNQLTGGLDSLKEQREMHLDRTGVLFHVGQVVQHRRERWRGVISGWQRHEARSEDKLTSLTIKDYSEAKDVILDEPVAKKETDQDDAIQYSLILDSGDAHLLGGRRTVHDQTGEPIAMQSDLEIVKDESLIRIRSNWTPHQFDRFDSTTGRFVPNAVRSFEYPFDNDHVDDKESPYGQHLNEVGGQIVSGVQTLASRLEREILDVTSSAESHGLGVLADFQQRLASLAQGNVVPDSALLSKTDVSQGDLAAYHLRQLLNITLEISELLWIRQISEKSKDKIRFSLGQVVQHKKYGFRGVVVAWDPKAAVDVTHWDGLAGIENPGDYAFYHIVPDQNDCIEAFGGERPFRYVCEANLEACPRESSFIEVDMDPEWQRKSTDLGFSYDAPEHSKFKYAEDADEDDVTAECLTSIMDTISRLQVSVRDSSVDVVDADLAVIAENLSLTNLFDMLKLVDTMDGATVIEETIKEIWKAHDNRELRSKLDDGIADLLRGNKERALTIFKKLIQEDPGYAEAWNKASTCYYMLGDMQLSLEAVERTLDLLPMHFQAMNGLGLVQYETRRYKAAAQTFRQSLNLDPWSPVSARLSACLDMLYGTDLEEERATPFER